MATSKILPSRAPRLSTTAAALGLLGTGAFAARQLYYSSRPVLLDSSKGMATYSSPKTFGGPPPFPFKSLKLQSVEQVNHNTKKLRFELPDKTAISGLPLTSALLSIHTPKGSFVPVLRPYTPISGSDEVGFVDLLVKQYPNGKTSTHLHNLKPGDTMSFGGAIPGYSWKPNKHAHIGLIAGGQGITPAYQLIRGVLSDPSDNTKITLVYGVNSDQDVLLREEFNEYEKKFPGRFRAHYTVSNPGPGSSYQKGYVTQELLEKTMPAAKEENIKLFLCGPSAMEEAVYGQKGWLSSKPGILDALGYSKSQVHRF